jgi:hypothetical protein
MTLNVDFTMFKGIISFASAGDKIVVATLGPPATVSEAELYFQLLSTMSCEERSNCIKIKVTQAHEHLTHLASFMESSGIEWSFTPCAFGVGDDDEICPGCGTFLGGDLNPLCEHPKGCGHIRSIPIAEEDIIGVVAPCGKKNGAGHHPGMFIGETCPECGEYIQ